MPESGFSGHFTYNRRKKKGRSFRIFFWAPPEDRFFHRRTEDFAKFPGSLPRGVLENPPRACPFPCTIYELFVYIIYNTAENTPRKEKAKFTSPSWVQRGGWWEKAEFTSPS